MSVDVAIASPQGTRVIPAEDLVGVAELRDLFESNIEKMTNLDPDAVITRQMVSMWYARRRTTHFPDADVKHLSRGLLWDVKKFRDADTGAMLWLGPPGRWGDARD